MVFVFCKVSNSSSMTNKLFNLEHIDLSVGQEIEEDETKDREVSGKEAVMGQVYR